MKIDSFLKIGHSHEICQDYIMTGTDPCPYIILSDGCSGAKDSDIGARILCHTALRYLYEHQSKLNNIDVDDMGQRIIMSAQLTASNFYTAIDCLDATLIIVYKFNGNYYIYMYGDGVIFRVDPDDEINYTRAYYKPNAPGYLRYSIDGYEKYKNADVIKLTDSHFGLNSYDAMEPYHRVVHEGDIKTLLVASDGVESFIHNGELLYKSKYLDLVSAIKMSNHDLSGMPELPTYNPEIKELNWENVVGEMIDFKNTNGVFLKRRVKKVMKNYLKEGFINDDDLSIGCFYEEWK